MLGVFNSFKELVETQSCLSLKSLRIDNKRECSSAKFDDFCADFRMQHQYTVSYFPQWNEVVERKNITIMEMARCLLAEKKMPKYFWAKTTNTAVHLLNKLPTIAVKDTSPIEAWNGTRPILKHLRVFGCIFYAHVPKMRRGKLDEKVEVVFIRYSSQAEGYRLYNLLRTKSIFISREMVFDEEAT